MGKPLLLYDKHGIQLYHGDCRDVLPTLDQESVTLICTDPPFNLSSEFLLRVEFTE